MTCSTPSYATVTCCSGAREDPTTLSARGSSGSSTGRPDAWYECYHPTTARTSLDRGSLSTQKTCAFKKRVPSRFYYEHLRWGIIYINDYKADILRFDTRPEQSLHLRSRQRHVHDHGCIGGGFRKTGRFWGFLLYATFFCRMAFCIDGRHDLQKLSEGSAQQDADWRGMSCFWDEWKVYFFLVHSISVSEAKREIQRPGYIPFRLPCSLVTKVSHNCG